MNQRNLSGWQALVEGFPWFRGEGHFPIPAYSEYMPPPRVGRSMYGDIDTTLFTTDDPYGWHITELEEELELSPGLAEIGKQIMEHLLKLGRGLPGHHIGGFKNRNLDGNPYWPPELAARAGCLDHERYTVFLPLALSRTQDDMGRVRWTLFGNSEQGPERAFWKSFYTAPGKELPTDEARGFIYRLLASAYGLRASTAAQLHEVGFRILPTEPESNAPFRVDPLPSWTTRHVVADKSNFDDVRYLLTFRPFARLPEVVRAKYLAGDLHLLPFPGSLAFWGIPSYLRLREQSPLALQMPLQRLPGRRAGPNGIRVPQTGWLHEPRRDSKESEINADLVVNTYTRTSRFSRVHRYEDATALSTKMNRVAQALFSTSLDVIGLYDKPMARNCQLFFEEAKLLLDGPRASRVEIERAAAAVFEGGLFRYRFQFPAMRVGLHEVYWQRPLTAYLSHHSGQVEIAPDLLGYMTAYRVDAPDLEHPIELWPRLLQRELYLSALRDFDEKHDLYANQTPHNVVELFDTVKMMGDKPLPKGFASQIVRKAKDESLEEWLNSLPEHALQHDRGKRIQQALEPLFKDDEPLPAPFTYEATATRAYEVAYWRDIAALAEGEYRNKDNADVVDDAVTIELVKHHQRDLEELGDYLLKRHKQAIAAAGMEGKALVGDLPFRWQTDFEFPMFGGWRSNQQGRDRERNILVIIPGKNRRQAVVLGDHYDTAYMEDVFDPSRGGPGARLSAAGADDNYSATATLLQAAPIYLKLAKEGKLERDIWLLHLTGEEFPSDCLGARHFCQGLIERSLRLRLGENEFKALADVDVVGVYVMDMIAHNRDNAQDIFQISPGRSAASLKLAYQAHIANAIWNDKTREWNKSEERRGKGRGKRCPGGIGIPATAQHLALSGEVRNWQDATSSLYNTDCQIFSDIGAPVVLFMENYDINRAGYHDTKDTMENIDLDYGAAVSAIAIETVARIAALAEF